jgi:hypothetical protein
MKLENNFSVYELSLETCRHPCQKHSSFWRPMVNQTVLYQTNAHAPGHKYFTPMKAEFQSKSKARLSSYQWTRGEAARQNS